MYGFVNNAIRSMVLEEAGPEVWDEIRAVAGVEDPNFRSLDYYDDAVTYGLVAAGSQVLGMPPADLLRAFGRYWILYTCHKGYGKLLDLSGSTVAEFLGNLDTMHANVMLSFTEINPPSFEREVRPDGSIYLRYYSDRKGLAPMILGLVEGLGEYLDDPVTIHQVTGAEDTGFDGFEIHSAGAEQNLSDAA